MSESLDSLEASLERIVDGTSSAPSDPTPQPELEPLRRVASRLHRLGSIAPSPAAVQRTRLALLKAAVEARSTTPTRHQWNGLRPRFAIAVPIALVLAALSSVAVLAAPSALPGSPFYGVRNIRESVEVQLAASPRERAVLYARFARQRAGQLRLAVAEKRVSAEDVSTLLRDIAARVDEADQEARDAGQPARDAVRESEMGIEADLSEVKASDDLSSTASEELDKTIQDVQSGESSIAPEPTNTEPSPTTDPTAAPGATPMSEPTATPEASSTEPASTPNATGISP